MTLDSVFFIDFTCSFQWYLLLYFLSVSLLYSLFLSPLLHAVKGILQTSFYCAKLLMISTRKWRVNRVKRLKKICEKAEGGGSVLLPEINIGNICPFPLNIEQENIDLN